MNWSINIPADWSLDVTVRAGILEPRNLQRTLARALQLHNNLWNQILRDWNPIKLWNLIMWTKLVPFYPAVGIFGRISLKKISLRKNQGRLILDFRLTIKKLGEISIGDFHGQKSRANVGKYQYFCGLKFIFQFFPLSGWRRINLGQLYIK